jgi:hypothetical protein
MTFAYLVTHFLVYLLMGRKLTVLRSERGIFRFHALSALTVVACSAIWGLFSGSSGGIAVILGVAAMHGIYSLSFLELWTLSQISYSRDILDAAMRGPAPNSELIAQLATVGDDKKVSRLKGLETLGLIRVAGDSGTIQLRRAGKAVSLVLTTLRWLTNLRSTG